VLSAIDPSDTAYSGWLGAMCRECRKLWRTLRSGVEYSGRGVVPILEVVGGNHGSLSVGKDGCIGLVWGLKDDIRWNAGSLG
jgi:hypothetical protein